MKITPIEDSAEYGGGAHGVRVANDSRTSNKRNEITPPKAPPSHQNKPHLRQSHDIPPAKSLPASRARLTGCRSLVRSPRKPKRVAAKTSRPHSGHVPSIAGGRGYLPRPWGSVVPGQCRPCQPRPDEGHVGD